MCENKELVKKINEHKIINAELKLIVHLNLVSDKPTQFSDGIPCNCEDVMLLTLGNGEVICFRDGEDGNIAWHSHLNKKTNKLEG